MSDDEKKRLPDYYRLLGLGPEAGVQEIKDAFRRLAVKLHPDVNANPKDHETFRHVSEAYRILSDPVQRKKYDTMRLLNWGLPIDRLQGWLGDPLRMQGVMNKAATVLAVAAGLIRKEPGRPGRDLTVNAALSLGESFHGAERRFEYGRECDCDQCRGTGWSQVSECETCKGKGRMISPLMPLITKRCPRCETRGWIGEERCVVCKGEGRVLHAHSVKTRIAAGVSDGYRVRVPGHGEGGRLGGKDGDLIVLVQVEAHETWRREGNDLIVALTVPFGRAALGGPLPASLPDGETAVRIPPGSWDGRRLRLTGRGFPDPKTTRRGDAFFVLSVERPAFDAEADRALIDEYFRTVTDAAHAPVGDFLIRLEQRFGQA